MLTASTEVGRVIVFGLEWLSSVCVFKGGHFAAIVIFVLPLIISLAFWRNLVWGKAGRDSLLLVGGVIAAGVVDYLAFFIRPR